MWNGRLVRQVIESPSGRKRIRVLFLAASSPDAAVISTLIAAAAATSDRRSPATTRPTRVAVRKMSCHGRLGKCERLSVGRTSRRNVTDGNPLLAVPLGIRTCCW